MLEVMFFFFIFQNSLNPIEKYLGKGRDCDFATHKICSSEGEDELSREIVLDGRLVDAQVA